MQQQPHHEEVQIRIHGQEQQQNLTLKSKKLTARRVALPFLFCLALVVVPYFSPCIAQS